MRKIVFKIIAVGVAFELTSNAACLVRAAESPSIEYESVITASGPVRIIVVPPEPCRPSGLISWWRGENNARDSAGSHHGRPIGAVSYVNGRVGRAFSFNGDTYVEVPNAADLNFGASRAMTVELWAYRTGDGAIMHFLGKRVNCGPGVANHYQMAFDPPRGLAFGVAESNVPTHIQMPMRTWMHLAATINGRTFKFFINGQLKATAQTDMGPSNTVPLRIAKSGNCGGNFIGYIDEVAIYNRTLSNAEIEAIYLFGLKGQSRATAPEITTQPQSQSVNAGATVAMRAAARSVDVLSYQWLLDGRAIPGATNDILTLSSVMLADAGDYSVQISNCAGSVATAAARLTVSPVNLPPTVKMTAPAGGATFPPGANILITAEASDPDGTVTRLRFYTNGVSFLTLTNPPAVATVMWSNVPSGSYTLTARAVNDEGVTATSAAVSIVVEQPQCVVEVYNNDFSQGANSDWSRPQTDVTPAGRRRFLGQFGNQTVRFSLANLPPHSEVILSFDIFVIRSWDGNNNSGEFWECYVPGGPTLLRTSFSVDTPAWSFRQSYPNQLGAGNFPARRGASENNTLGHTWSGYAMDCVYRIERTFAHSASRLDVDFRAGGLEVLDNESWGLDNVVVKVTTKEPPVVTKQPASQRSRTGSNVTFGVQASSLGDTFYQWYLGDKSLPGAIQQTLTITNVRTADAGEYWVRVMNCAGFTDSERATLILNTPPAIVIISPLGGSRFLLGSPITVTADARDSEGPLKLVGLYANGSRIGPALTNAPYTFFWTDAPLGTNVLTAKALDAEGESTTSAEVSIVVEQKQNQPPTISPIRDLLIPEDTTTPSIPFTIGDAETLSVGLAISIASSNGSLVLWSTKPAPTAGRQISRRPRKSG